MREIKFRAWDIIDKKMIDSSDIDSQLYFPSFDPQLSIGRYLENGDWEQDLPIMQFTGLKDKNGKEIYEGDLLRYATSDGINFTAFEVFFHDGDANSDYNIGFSMSRAHFHGNIAGHHIPSFKPKTTKQMEVIGNIYQNPELL